MALGASSATAGIINAAKSEVALAEAQVRGMQVSTARARAAVYRAQQALAAARVQTRRPLQKNGSHWRRSHLTVIFRPEYPLRLR